MLSARVTVVLFILICFEIGMLLILLPWHRTWEDNNILYFFAEWLNSPTLAQVVMSSYFRGLVSGLGVVNLLIGLWEIAHFKETVKTFSGDDASVPNH